MKMIKSPPEMRTKRLKVLLGCYACDPNFGSEPGMGWNFVSNIAKFHDVHAIVEEGEFKESLMLYATSHPEEVRNITFHFVPRSHHNILRKIWPPSYYWFYRAWNKRAYKLAVELDRKEHFDIVHQITLAGYREPGYLWKLNKKFIWGPIGGFNQTAWRLLPCMGLRGTIFYTLRNIINGFQKRFSYAARIVSRKAHTILTSDTYAQGDIKRLWHRDAVVMQEVGTSETFQHHERAIHQAGEELIICWAGVHEPRKGLGLLIEALAQCKFPFRLHVLGHGPCTEKWKKMALAHKLDNHIIFHGKLPHQEVFRYMAESHVFCITSLSEGGTTTVIMEALQHGLPTIALDHCGFSTTINETCGFKIPIQSRSQITADIARHLDYLASHEDERQKLSIGALNQCRKYTWNAKMSILNKIYESASGPQTKQT